MGAAGLYFAQKNSAPGRATGHMIGAGSAGVAITTLAVLKENFKGVFDGLVDVRYSGYGDMYVNEQLGPADYGRYGDLYANESTAFPPQMGNYGGYEFAESPALAEVMAHAMGDSDGDMSDVEALMYL